MPDASRHSLTSPERVLWPDTGLTKQGLLEYYVAVWRWMGPHVVGRPLALLRCPDGVGESCFFQKHAAQSLPEGIRTVTLDEANDLAPVIDDFTGLAGLVQLSVLEIHPWSAKADDIEHADHLIFDLDPDPSIDWDEVTAAALLLRKKLEDLGLAAFAKTSGGKGLHVIAPLDATAEWEQVRDFARDFSKRLAEDEPERLTAQSAKDRRQGRIFIDYLRNGRGTTSVAAYCPRARPGAAVAAPVTWAEVEAGVRADAFTVENMPERLASLARDPWDGFDAARRPLPKLP